MIDPRKLQSIRGGQRRRKLALCLGALERDILGVEGRECPYSFPLPREEYVRRVASVVLSDPALGPAASQEIRALCEARPLDELRLCNVARNHLLSLMGTLPAEWDLIVAPHGDGSLPRRSVPGVAVYAEDIRSPFNLGSIFRTAEAFGAEKIFLSPLCCPPEHPRAVRSAMGCVGAVPYERVPIERVPDDARVFVLETGGTPLSEFDFPKNGILVVGSEELGVSPRALRRADAGCAGIPLIGKKSSLNVGVALGIALSAWTDFLARAPEISASGTI